MGSELLLQPQQPDAWPALIGGSLQVIGDGAGAVVGLAGGVAGCGAPTSERRLASDDAQVLAK